MSESTKFQIRRTPLALDYAKAALGSPHFGYGENETIKHLRVDKGLERAITNKLDEMGQHRLINLTHSYDEARISAVFYAGEGIVLKIIPSDYFDDSNPLFSLPPITLDRIKIEDDCRDMLIATFPWVHESFHGKEALNEHEKMLNSVGMSCPPDDRDTRNFRSAPDKAGTIFTIDSGIYKGAHNGVTQPPHLKEAWNNNYIREIYPIYKTGIIPPQTDKTDFSFKSIHDRNHTIAGFDITKENPIVRLPEKQPKRNFWQSLFSPPDNEPSF